MSGHDLLESLTFIDSELVEAAEETSRPYRRWYRRWPLAACLCLLLAGGALAAELAGGNVVIQEMFSRPKQSGYQLEWGVEHIPVSEFSAAVQADTAGWKTFEDKVLYLDTWKDGEEYLGITMANPLEDQEWLTKTSHSAWYSAGSLTQEERAAHCRVTLLSNGEGALIRTELQSGYRVNGVYLILRGIADTEHLEETAYGHFWDGMQVEFETETCTTRSGDTAILVTNSGVEDQVEAYFVHEGVAYSLRALRSFGDEDPVEAAKWALDCF